MCVNMAMNALIFSLIELFFYNSSLCVCLWNEVEREEVLFSLVGEGGCGKSSEQNKLKPMSTGRELIEKARQARRSLMKEGARQEKDKREKLVQVEVKFG